MGSSSSHSQEQSLLITPPEYRTITKYLVCDVVDVYMQMYILYVDLCFIDVCVCIFLGETGDNFPAPAGQQRCSTLFYGSA